MQIKVQNNPYINYFKDKIIILKNKYLIYNINKVKLLLSRHHITYTFNINTNSCVF
jgi:hypothetical protein